MPRQTTALSSRNERTARGSDAHASTEPATLAAGKGTDLSVPLPFTRTVWPGHGGASRAPAADSPSRRASALSRACSGRARWSSAAPGCCSRRAWRCWRCGVLLSTEPLQEFLAAYPGEYPLPEGAPVGIPPWLGWQHFFNTFLIVLIIRSGLQVRTEKRPSVFWSPRNNGKRKISLNLWFHQSLDILWITNGVIYVVLLFVTGQWMKIVPTSWAVFPNAV